MTGFIQTFCDKIELAGFDACYYASKTMAYDYLDLSQLTSYDLWYAEYRSTPSFYYDFGMWQYTQEGNVSGISGSVPITLALKKLRQPLIFENTRPGPPFSGGPLFCAKEDLWHHGITNSSSIPPWWRPAPLWPWWW